MFLLLSAVAMDLFLSFFCICAFVHPSFIADFLHGSVASFMLSIAQELISVSVSSFLVPNMHIFNLVLFKYI